MKLSIKSKFILMISLIFFVISSITSILYVKNKKEQTFKDINDEITIITNYKRKEINRVEQYRINEFKLIADYLSDYNEIKSFDKKIKNVCKLSPDIKSIQIINLSEHKITYQLKLDSTQLYDIKLTKNIKVNNINYKISLTYSLNINLKSPLPYLNYCFVIFNKRNDSIKIITEDSIFYSKSNCIYELKNTNYIYSAIFNSSFLIQVNKKLINQNINQKLIKNILLNFLVLFLIIVIITYVVFKYFIKDIHRINNAISQIILGNLDYRIMHKRNDELGDLMNYFNIMSENLKIKINDNIRLEDEKNKYIALLDSTFEGIFLTKNGEFVDCNLAACKMFGYSYNEMKKLKATDIIAPEDRTIVKHNIETQNEIPYKVKGLRKDKTTLDILIRGKMFEYNNDILRTTSIIDITSSTKLERIVNILNEEIEKFKALLNMSDDGIILLSLESGNIVQLNDAFLNMLGYTRDNTELKNPMKSIDKWAHPKYIQTVKEHFSKEEPYKIKMIKQNGEIFDCLIKGKNITLNKKRYRITVFRDITDKTTIELYAKKLEQSNKELEQFAYIASHDLQEPIRTITSFLELFEDRYINKVDKDGREFITYIMTAAHKQKRLINDLLKYSRLDSRKIEIKKYDLNQILEVCLLNLNKLIDEKHAIIINKHLPEIYCDFTQMSQVFENLIKNAIKFNKNKPHIKIDYEDRKDDILITIEDNGIGIDNKYFEKIFNAFQRLCTDTTGTGMGLAIVNKVIKNHNGKIWLESIINKGTKFYFTISKKLNKYENS